MKFAFIGAGNMAGALIKGMINCGVAQAQDISVYDVDKSKYNMFKALGVYTSQSSDEAISRSDYVVLALKPQTMGDELKRIGAGTEVTGKLFISLAAGITIGFICSCFGKDVPVVRTMPNTPLMIGQGMTAICRNSLVDDKRYTVVCRIFASLGKILSTTEDMMDAVVSVNGSSPAYIYLFAQAMLESAVGQGFTREEIYPAVVQSLKGSIEMMEKEGKYPEELIKIVCSKGGTTEQAMNSFERDGLIGIVDNAMKACTRRANELTEQFSK